MTGGTVSVRFLAGRRRGSGALSELSGIAFQVSIAGTGSDLGLRRKPAGRPQSGRRLSNNGQGGPHRWRSGPIKGRDRWRNAYSWLLANRSLACERVGCTCLSASGRLLASLGEFIKATRGEPGHLGAANEWWPFQVCVWPGA